MNLLDLESFAWARELKDVKVVRHYDSKIDYSQLVENGEFEEYQDNQSKNVFLKARYIISFIAEKHGYARFVGVWEINKTTAKKSGGFKYITLEKPSYEDLKTRLIVEWGAGTRSWVQWLHRAGNKPIFELLPKNYVKDFPGFYNFTLNHDELVKLIAHPDSNREWQRMLSSVSGVYIILHQESGRQYIGSAYGENGIWGRWKRYSKSPSGDNLLLKQLIEEKPDAHKFFRFSVLRVLESGATKDDVLKHESLIKIKLGSRTFGLNT